MELKTYLIKNAQYLKIQAIEKSAGIPATVLHKYMHGKANLKDKHQEILKQWLEGLNYKS